MKKIIYHLILYIGVFLLVFKPVNAVIADSLWTDDEFYNQLQVTKAEEISSEPVVEDSLSVIKRVENEIIKFFVMPFIIDKVYPQEKIQGDISGVLRLAWPDISQEKLDMIIPFMKGFVSIKRRYEYVINRLEQKIKASEILPSESPIVAKDGEYASKYPDKKKETSDNEYKVSYKPYKYLEYDGDALGEPVRMRDKNYEPISETVYDELILAFLKFDIAKFYKALGKMHISNDGTREKINELGDGVRSRILLATKYPGDLETIEGLIEIYVPQGWYINGDYLNLTKKPQFFLSEDSKEDLNIKGYKLSYPLANGVVNHGKTSRILTGDIRFPLEISRRDKEKPMHIRGSFTFELCRQGGEECRYVSSKHAISLEPSVKEEDSVHANFVRKGFWDIPQEKNKDVEIDKVFYTPDTGNLTIKFKTKHPFSNVAVMAEDAVGSDFINPQYTIGENEIIATFKNNSFQKTIDNDTHPIAVSATFDDREALRKVIEPEIFILKKPEKTSAVPNYLLAFLFGILINIMPAALCLLQRLLILFKEKENYIEIFIRYALGSALGLSIMGIYISTHTWYLMYGELWLNLAAVMLSVSYLSSVLGYMNFNLFRPFKRIFKRGFLIGLFTILLMAAFPYLLKNEVMGNAPTHDAFAQLKFFGAIWTGVLIIPLIVLMFHKLIIELPLKLRFLNVPYTIFYILGLLWIVWNNRGISALIVMIIVSIIVLLLWYIYPLAIEETVSHKRTKTDKIALFRIVQSHCTIILFVIFILSLTICNFAPITKHIIPQPAEEISAIKQHIDDGKTILISFNADWQQPLALQNRMQAKTISLHNIEVKMYTLPTNNSVAEEWFKLYNKSTPPLNILFSKRHPNGLVLPSALRDVNWAKAVRNFE